MPSVITVNLQLEKLGDYGNCPQQLDLFSVNYTFNPPNSNSPQTNKQI